MNDCETLIVGAGPAGSLSALYLLQAGITPVILEKEGFPRYHIGESLTGECGACLRELGLEEQLSTAAWPVKHGVTVYGAGGKNSFWVPVKKRNEAEQLEAATTWQVRRSDFDQMLLETAVARGAKVIKGEALMPLTEGNRVTGVRYRTADGSPAEISCRALLDASGSATFLASKSSLTSPKELGHYNRQIALFSQVTDALRDPGEASGNTLIFTRQKHHWAWFIPLDEQTTSVGVVLPADYFKAAGLSPGELLPLELHRLNPELTKRLPKLDFVEPARTISNYSYHVRRFTGSNWLCVGDSHRFIDPIFSFGVYFATKESSYAARAIKSYLHEGDRDAFAAYQATVEAGQDVIQDLLDCFWEHPVPFLMFAHFAHAEEMIDLFAGRIYGPQVAEMKGVQSIRRLLAKSAASGQAANL